LVRAELTAAQEVAAIYRRKAIYEELHPETKAGTAQAAAMNQALGRGDVSENSAFTSATAETTGKSRRSVEIAAARGKALGDDLAAVQGTSLDKGVELTPSRRCPLASARASYSASCRMPVSPFNVDLSNPPRTSLPKDPGIPRYSRTSSPFCRNQ
jgi:hypothetical protein